VAAAAPAVAIVREAWRATRRAAERCLRSWRRADRRRSAKCSCSARACPPAPIF
jgi:hypothetical protein